MIKWLFFDLGGTVYDETFSDKQRIDGLIEKAQLDIAYSDFYAEMQKSAAEFAPSPFSAARGKFGIKDNVPYSNEKEILYPNAVEVIKKLSEKYRLGIIANQPPNTDERLKNDGLYDLFEICLLSECVNLFKPDMAFFECAFEEAGCNPYEAVMIGDRLDNDVFPAKSVGMKTVRVVQGLYSVQCARSDEYAADYEITKLEGLIDIDF
ncbi:MAG: HAD-IA family hydrolase [Oscillospiraceae bacterium]|nr:HAD-IA family hydrolase [Oscillospiraceae bacterium]